MEGPTKRLRVAIEPPPVGVPSELFASPSRLLDILPDGTEQFTSDGPEKSIGERLGRIWAERGDFSLLSHESIKAAAAKKAAGEDAVEGGDGVEADARMSPDEMRELQHGLINQLELARGELMTALDLLSVLAPPTDPPSVDPTSLPLPVQSLVLVPTRPPSSTPEDPLLPLATSLSSLRTSATSFLTASASLSSQPPSPWPTLLRLRSTSSFTLLPIGAGRGATLTGTGEGRAAREVGVFFGCPEAKEPFRRPAIARVADLKGNGRGRTLVLEVEMEGVKESVCWGPEEAEEDEIEKQLDGRSRAAFAEEIFATLSAEARADSQLKAHLVLGKRSQGDSVITTGHGWTLTLTMVASPPPPTTHPSLLPLSLLPLLRLLFLQEYALRRAPPSTLLWTRPILQTLSVLLSHVHRRRALVRALDDIAESLREGAVAVEVEYVAGGRSEERDIGGAVLRILRGEKELGGLVVLRVARTRVFHIAHSFLLPQAATSATVALQHQSLVLQSPGKAAPVPIPSLAHLSLFLTEHVEAIRREKAATMVASGKGKAVADGA